MVRVRTGGSSLEEIARILGAVHPFSGLDRDALARAASRAAIEYFPAGATLPATVVSQDVTRRVIVRSGSLELHLPATAGGGLAGRAGEGDAVPPEVTFRGLRFAPAVTAIEDTLVLLVPDDEVGPESLSPHPSPVRTCGDLQGAGFVACAPDLPVGEAALRMRTADAALLVVTTVPPSLVTDRDLRNQVVAAGLPPSAPVATIADAAVPIVPAPTPAADALIRLLEAGSHRALVERDGAVVAVLSRDDLARVWSPVPPSLASDADGIDGGSRAWLDATGRCEPAAAYRAASIDSIVRAAVGSALAEIGPPPCPFAWIALGPLARRDPAGPFDECSVLVAEDGGGRTLAALASLAAAVSSRLAQAGLPACPSNTIASNPLWCRGLGTWRQYFDGWTTQRDPASAARAGAFLDARAVAGDPSLASALRSFVRGAFRGDPSFRARLVEDLRAPPTPLGFFRGAVLERDGRTIDRLDVDARLLEPIAACARVVALDGGSDAAGTSARLREAAVAPSAHAATLDGLADVFDRISCLRLRTGPIVGGPDLQPADRRVLERAFRAVDDAIALLASPGEGA